MIETREEFDAIHDASFQDMEENIWICFRCEKPLGETPDCRSCQISLLKETVDRMLPFVRLVREERIIRVGSHVKACSLCQTSWLRGKQEEHHERNCLFYDLPRWLGNE